MIPNAAHQPSVELHWLDNHVGTGTTFGVPWPRGTCPAGAQFGLRGAQGPIPLQSWTLARWPDGSVKWSAHAAGVVPKDGAISLVVGEGGTQSHHSMLEEDSEYILINTGKLSARIAKAGDTLFSSLRIGDRELAGEGELIFLLQDQPAVPEEGTVAQSKFTSHVEKVSVEQTGPVRTVVKVQGAHRDDSGRRMFPFVVRMYFYAGSDVIRVVHTFIFDADEHHDFVRGIGLRFSVPMRDQLHDRHVRLVGQDDGVFAEAVRPLTGLWKQADATTRTLQVAGRKTPPTDTFPNSLGEKLNYIPSWGDFTLSQLCADGFSIRKRTKPGHGWIDCDAGSRSAGTGYVGGVSGGISFAIRDFWQKHPSQLDIRNASTGCAQVTLWLWSPDAPAMDLRVYHDGLGLKSHAEEIDAMYITYEDHQAGWGTPQGISRTSEMSLKLHEATPSREQLVEFARSVQHPPVLVCEPARYLQCKVFGAMWSLPDRTSALKSKIEDDLELLLDFYLKEVDARRWYGFWNFGDVMHAYDPDRHCWRYDIGGYAWDNSELSPDLWLWYSFLRTGRADVFRLAEAMTRHTGEVDVHHTGRFAGLGSRHNVQHWGCSCKQLRISSAIYRRFYYYLTADERVGDLMRETLTGDRTFLTVDPYRKIRKDIYSPKPGALAVGFGTDWGALASSWLTEWERTGDKRWLTKLHNGMKSISRLRYGFFTAGATYDLSTGEFSAPADAGVAIMHLSAVFGLVEVCAELIDLIDCPEFETAWLNYCEYYSATEEDRQRALGFAHGTAGLTDAHSRLTAYAALRRNKPDLARRAWKELRSNDIRRSPMVREQVHPPAVLKPVTEIPWISTNGAAQWSLAAIQNLGMIGDLIE